MIQSQNGYPILVTRRNGSIFLNDAQMVGTNYIAKTGAVHALDRVRTSFSKVVLLASRFLSGGNTRIDQCAL